MWTVLLALCPSTESPLTLWSTSTPSTPHSLKLFILGLASGLVVPQCPCAECKECLLLEKHSDCWTDSSVCTCLSLSLTNTFSHSWIQSVDVWNSSKWFLVNFFLFSHKQTGSDVTCVPVHTAEWVYCWQWCTNRVSISEAKINWVVHWMNTVSSVPSSLVWIIYVYVLY